MPAPHENGLAVVHASGEGGATMGDAVVELIMFILARRWGIEVDVEGSASGEDRLKFAVEAGMSAAEDADYKPFAAPYYGVGVSEGLGLWDSRPSFTSNIGHQP